MNSTTIPPEPRRSTKKRTSATRIPVVSYSNIPAAQRQRARDERRYLLFLAGSLLVLATVIMVGVLALRS